MDLAGADEQIEAYAQGLPNDPPRRMCDKCKADFGAIADREVRCRTSGCKKTWTWTRSDQLDACLAGKPTPKAPHRMCESCIAIYRTLQDVERPCRRSGCKGVWLDKRGGQLARAVRGKTGDPYPQYCDDCAKDIVELEDRQLPCKTDNCTGTWTWAKAAAARGRRAPGAQGAASTGTMTAEAATAEAASDQWRRRGDRVGGRRAARSDWRRSQARRARRSASARSSRPSGAARTAATSSRTKKTLEIPCKQCATPIYWPPESQLQTHLGAWAEPALCGACKRDAMEAARAAEREALRHGTRWPRGRTKRRRVERRRSRGRAATGRGAAEARSRDSRPESRC